MHKWIYSSVSLNIMSLIGIIWLLISGGEFFRILFTDLSVLGDVIGLGYLPKSAIFSVFLILFYILELILNRVNSKFGFIFPALKIRYKFIYCICFYIGLLFGAGYIIFIFTYIVNYIFT